MTLFVRNISHDRFSDLQKAFEEIDQNKTGSVTADDIIDALRRNGYKVLSNEIVQLMSKVDYLGNGKLNYTQFLIVAMDRRQIIDDEAV